MAARLALPAIRRRPRSAADALSHAFAESVLAGESAPGSHPPRVGLEHEYAVHRGVEQIDFGAVVHGLGLGERHLDPNDRNAYRIASGAAVTADGPEAEIAIPPIPLQPGFASRLRSLAVRERASLARLVSPLLRLHGYSTHLNVGLADELIEPAARLYARTFAPGLMLLMDRATSPGLLVRPRAGRLELGGEFVSGSTLEAAAAFAAGSTIACARALTEGLGSAYLPPELDVRTVGGIHRYGWYVDRGAFGPDLYSAGRAAMLRIRRGGTISAQEHLAQCWALARAALSPLVADEDLEAATRMVAGDLPLPCEAGPDQVDATPVSAHVPTQFTGAVSIRERPRWAMAPVMLTWDLGVYLAGARDGSVAFACVPGGVIDRFLRQVDSGRLDALVERYLDLGPTGRRLERRSQTAVPGLFDALGRRRRLLPAEKSWRLPPAMDILSAALGGNRRTA